jgi:hypothetical protein
MVMTPRGTLRRATTTLLSLAVAALLLPACGTPGGDPTSEPTSAPDATPVAPTTDGTEDPPQRVPGFPDDTAPQAAENSGEWDLVFTDIRVAEHEGFDRIVLEFTGGAGRPGWTAGYVDEAALDASGEVLTLAGDAVLDVYATGVTWPSKEYYSGPRQFQPQAGNVADVHVGATFEGYQQMLVGIDGTSVPFRIFALSAPTRLVIDVAGHSDD